MPRVLEPEPTLSFGNQHAGNLIIEGDNLQVMVSLRSQFTDAVDVVYIDPPYNRGGNDFRYSDARFEDPNADGSDSHYVSNDDGGARHAGGGGRVSGVGVPIHPDRAGGAEGG